MTLVNVELGPDGHTMTEKSTTRPKPGHEARVATTGTARVSEGRRKLKGSAREEVAMSQGRQQADGTSPDSMTPDPHMLPGDIAAPAATFGYHNPDKPVLHAHTVL